MASRKHYTSNENTILFNEVDGHCPLCGIPLIYEKGGKLNRRVNLAHIYPHSPTKKEKELLKDVEILSDDREDIKNIIWLCPNCHEKFDKPRTLEGYNKVLNIKKQILKEKETKDLFHEYKIEDDIKQIINKLTNEDLEEFSVTELSYNPKVIDNKLDVSMNAITKRKIKTNVSEYFYIVRKEFQNLDAITPNKATKIATQIKSFYLEANEKQSNQEDIYKSIVDWLHSKTKINYEASSVIISYFIQNCEVFDVVS